MTQLKGRLTKRRYKCATVFVDHYSDLTYIHHHSRLTSEKQSARNYGVRIQQCHCDNGRFADNAFINESKISGQSVSYCSVNGHFQNGRAEKRVRDLREAARTMLLHVVCPDGLKQRLFTYGHIP